LRPARTFGGRASTAGARPILSLLPAAATAGGDAIALIFGAESHGLTDAAFFEGGGQLDESVIPDLQRTDLGASPALDQ